MPDGSHEFTSPRSVAIFSTEDDADDTLIPRLIAEGADLSRVHFPRVPTENGGQRPFRFPEDLALMQEFIFDCDVVFSVIDPWVAHVQGKTDTHKDQDVRVVMGGLHAVAANTNSAIMCIRHIIKGENATALHAGGGSVGIIGDARAAVMHLRDPEDPDLLYMFSVKENLAVRGTTLRYRVESVDVEVSDGTMSVPRIIHDGEDPRDAETLFREIQSAKRKPGPAADELQDAYDVIDLMLGEGKRVSSKELDKAAKAHGVTAATMKRARKKRGIAGAYVVDANGKAHWEVYDPAAALLPSLPQPTTPSKPEPEQPEPRHPKTGKPFTSKPKPKTKPKTKAKPEPKTCACSDKCKEPVLTERHKYAEGHRP